MTNIFKNIFGTPFKHKKLSDDWANLQTSVSEGVTFTCRELGSTVVTEAQNEVATAEAIRRVIHLVRATHAKPKKVTLHVSSKGVQVKCPETEEMIRDTNISDIAYCSADSQYNHVIAFISNGERNAFDCYAYLCQSSKAAQNVALAIAQAFNLAYNESWQAECEETTEWTGDSRKEGIDNNLIEIESTNPTEESKEPKVTMDKNAKELSLSTSQDFVKKDIDITLESLDPLSKWNENKEKLKILNPKSSGSDRLRNWTSFEDDKQPFLTNQLSSLELCRAEKGTATKPPQRCKSTTCESSDNGTIKLSLSKANPLEMKLSKSIPLESDIRKRNSLDAASDKTFGASSSFGSANGGDTPTNNVFSEFETLWKSKSETLDWETFSSNSPFSSSLSINLCQSPAAVKPSGAFKWTSFSD